MPDLNQFIDPDLSLRDVTHSNGFGAVAGGGGAGGLSIEQRRQLLNKPRVIGAYEHSSRLARQGSAVKARTADQKNGRVYDASSDSLKDEASMTNRQTAAIKDRNQVDTKSVERRQHFIEPQTRTYDKYG